MVKCKQLNVICLKTFLAIQKIKKQLLRACREVASNKKKRDKAKHITWLHTAFLSYPTLFSAPNNKSKN